jgi:succinate dehydrogenase / fumarate reductase iron-sulfur subunit
VAPLRYLPVQRDLIVDQSAFFEKYRSVKPFLINDEPVQEKERIQSQDERMRFDDTTNCILCASCYSACPILEENSAFLGPAAISQAYRFLADTRDNGFEERLPVLDDANGVWPCQNHFKCTQTCPRSILITKRINQTKKMIEKHRSKAEAGYCDEGTEAISRNSSSEIASGFFCCVRVNTFRDPPDASLGIPAGSGR